MPFSAKISAIRKSYNLSYRNLADILNIQGGSINNWEKERAVPAFNNLKEIVFLFGVSSDWLLDLVEEPYNTDILSKIENELITSQIQIHSNGSKALTFKPDFFPEEYYNSELRSVNYSLPVRGNIVFLLNITKTYMEFLYYHQYANDEKTNFRYFQTMSDPSVFENFFDKNRLYTEKLLLLLNKKSAIPVYDIAQFYNFPN